MYCVFQQQYIITIFIIYLHISKPCLQTLAEGHHSFGKDLSHSGGCKCLAWLIH